MFKFEIEVLKYNLYGDHVESRTPASILANDRAEVTEKVRAVFNATYDDFRKFWSHNWRLFGVTEVADAPSTPEQPEGETRG